MLAAVLLGLLMAPGPADDEVAALNARIAREVVRGRYLVEKVEDVESALVATERAIADRQRESERLVGERRTAERDKAAATDRVAETRAQLAELRGEVGRRAAAMRRISRLGPETFWLRIEDPVRARRTRDRLRFVLEHDARLAREIRSAIAREANDLARIEDRIRQIESARARATAETAELDRLRAERAALLDALGRERQRSDRIAELLARARREGEAASQFVGGETAPPPATGGFAAQEGRLPWPTPGRVEVTFGAKVHPAGVIVRQTGIDIRAPGGQPVTAPHEGEVVFAGRLQGWGRVVILEHDGVYFTTYAHLARLDVEVGDAVERGQALGTVGASGSRKGPYLYFEIRRREEALDPWPWLFR